MNWSSPGLRRAAAALVPLAAAAAQQPAAAQPTTAPQAVPVPIEFGTVAWGRDFDAATANARQRGVPLLVLFQEVPG